MSKSISEGKVKKDTLEEQQNQMDSPLWTLDAHQRNGDLSWVDFTLPIIFSGDLPTWKGWCWQRMTGAGDPQEPLTTRKHLQGVNAAK